ncbi:hypothetical protein OHT20_00820 [Streptomyces caniferus]|uniref:Uncharacterized protein n=1 Tax=Streptomyces caniferus TaxID=285557 RepID=A0A640S3U8_9ACTN|nr:hypothetical protein [Streptomyces caniferus]GFE05657.1 hypothetical protein Scani_19250 [Streptomyces caniferus]
MASKDRREDEEPEIHIGNVQGSAFSIGDHNTVVSPVSGSSLDPVTNELATVVRELRADLARVRPTAEVDVLAAELEGAQAEIEQTGSVTPGRLARLRQVIAQAQAVVGFLASGAALTQVMGRIGASPQMPPTRHTSPGPSTSSDDDEWPESE